MALTNNSRLFLAGCVFLIVSTAAVYWQVSRFDFVNYDDPSYVTENPYVLQGFTWEGIRWAFTSSYASNWHPLTWLSLMLDRELFSTGPRAFHLVSVLLHIVNTVLLFIVMIRLSGNYWPSFFVAAAFSLHPLHVESVAWVAERKDVLSTLFCMLTILAYVRYVERPTVGWYVTISAVYALGLMSKPMLVTLPFVLLLVDYWPLQRMRLSENILQENPDRRYSTRTISFLVLEKVPLFVLSAASCVITFIAQKGGGTVSTFEVFSLSDRITNALVSYTGYVGEMFWPVGLAIFYPHPQGNIPLLKIVISAMFLCAVSLVTIFSCRKKRYLLVGWLWYLGTLVPVIGLVQVGAQAMADRYTYIPVVGLFLMIAWSVNDIVSKWRYKNVILATGGALVCAILMVCTYRQVGYWRNSVTLFTHALDVTSGNYVAHNNLGIALAENGDLEQAMKHFKETLKVKPRDIDAHFNLAEALVKVGKLDEAMVHYNRVLEIRPDDADTFQALAIAQVQQGDYEQAISIYHKALQKNPESALLHGGLGFALLQTGQLDLAITELQTAVRIKPSSETYCNLGIAVSSKGQLDEAAKYYKKSIQLDPKNAEAHFNLANVYLSQGRLPEAVAEYEKAINVNSGYVKAISNLAVALARLGRTNEAIANFRQVVELDPNSPVARFNLASSLADKGLIDEAIQHLNTVVQLAPQDVDARCMLADLLVRQRKVEQAIAEYEEVLKTDPTHQRARLGLQSAQTIGAEPNKTW